jgi:hypothetical protein
MPLPPDFSRGYTSIYELQSHAAAVSGGSPISP